jgi:hypothetical protein
MHVEDREAEQLQPREDAVEFGVVADRPEEDGAVGSRADRELREGRGGGRGQPLGDPPVTLVCGHAGAGKTTLLAAWATAAVQAGRLVAWYALDRFDDDPTLLWNGILAAARATDGFPVSSPVHDLVAPPREATGAFVDTVVDAITADGSPVWLRCSSCGGTPTAPVDAPEGSSVRSVARARSGR